VEGIFKNYQRKCYEYVQQWLNAEDIKHEEYLHEANDSCLWWIEEVCGLEDGLEKIKTLAILSWQNVVLSHMLSFPNYAVIL